VHDQLSSRRSEEDAGAVQEGRLTECGGGLIVCAARDVKTTKSDGDFGVAGRRLVKGWGRFTGSLTDCGNSFWSLPGVSLRRLARPPAAHVQSYRLEERAEGADADADAEAEAEEVVVVVVVEEGRVHITRLGGQLMGESR